MRSLIFQDENEVIDNEINRVVREGNRGRNVSNDGGKRTETLQNNLLPILVDVAVVVLGPDETHYINGLFDLKGPLLLLG